MQSKIYDSIKMIYDIYFFKDCTYSLFSQKMTFFNKKTNNYISKQHL